MANHVGPGSYPERYLEVFMDLHYAYTRAHPDTQQRVAQLVHERWQTICPTCDAAMLALLRVFAEHGQKKHFATTIEGFANERLIEGN